MNDSVLLALWVVYDRPLDFPHHVVVRCQRVSPTGIEHAYTACLYDSLVDAHAEFKAQGCYHWLPRQHGDDPMIVGCWV